MRNALNFGFRGRLLLAMLSLVTLTGLGLGSLIMLQLFSEEKERASGQLDVAGNVAHQVIESRTRLLTTNLTIVVEDFGFKRAIASRDLATIQSALQNHSRRTGAQLAMLADRDGQLITALQDLEPGTDLPFQKLLDKAREQSTASDVVSWGGDAYQVIIVPVDGPGLRAWMAAGFPLDRTFAGFISDITSTDVLFLRVTDDGTSTLASSLTQTPGLEDTGSWTDQFFTRRLALSDDDDSAIQALLLINRQETLQSYYRLTLEIAALMLGSLLVAGLLVLVVARTLGRPVLDLADFASAIGEDRDPDPPARANVGELATLRDALTNMQQRIRNRERKIRHDAQHDELTDLPNRNAMEQRIGAELSAARRFTVIGVSLSGFKAINETLGFDVGDQALIVTALRLRAYTPPGGIVARTGGNEFMLIATWTDPERVDELAAQLREQAEKTSRINDSPIRIQINMAFMTLPDDAGDLDAMRRRMKLTLDRARQAGTRYARYQPGGDEDHLRELKLVRDLETAIADGDLHMNYQPKLSMHSARVVQFEALIRWRHPELGFINPEEFIRLAEQSGQTHKLTTFIMECIARDTHEWPDALAGTGIAINLSALDLDNSDLPNQISRIFHKWQQNMALLTFEITESALMDDAAAALEALQRIRQLGCQLAVDDFGTGYSSLSQLRQLPVTELKIDKSFVLNLASEDQDRLIVRSTIELAHGLGLSVVAEGIENAESWQLLRDWGCEHAQGFFMARPMPADGLADWIGSFSSRARTLSAPADETANGEE